MKRRAYLLLPQAHLQVADVLDGGLDVRLLVGLDVDEAAQALLDDDALDGERLAALLVQVGGVLAHEPQRGQLLGTRDVRHTKLRFLQVLRGNWYRSVCNDNQPTLPPWCAAIRPPHEL